MTTITATDLKNNLGQYLQQIYREPLIIKKTGRPTAVMLSYEDYQKMLGQTQQQKEFQNNQEKSVSALREIQAMFRKLNKNKKDSVEQFLIDRRLDAKRENEE